jgi:hypothetical protein
MQAKNTLYPSSFFPKRVHSPFVVYHFFILQAEPPIQTRACFLEKEDPTKMDSGSNIPLENHLVTQTYEKIQY